MRFDLQHAIPSRVVALTEWLRPINHAVRSRSMLLDLHAFLPHDNIEAWIKDNPAPPKWHSMLDDGTGEEVWYLVPSYEQWEWFVAVIIHDNDWASAEHEDRLARLIEGKEAAAIESIIDMVRPCFEYQYRKSEKELKAMYSDFERIIQNAPQGTNSRKLNNG